ncbi:hypothetical protein Bca52824_078356 [Brassica carinata]|uniref:Uncharacterized protein n=1 Tax=Brassica carinata TaxID=52824 RepID=A0A8X7PYI1_BRACI|nr:hypothetical protein Bca52824_078356 [Brassica carinata]
MGPAVALMEPPRAGHRRCKGKLSREVEERDERIREREPVLMKWAEAKKPDIEKCLEVVATLEARTLSKQTTVQAREVVSSLVETIQGASQLGGCFKAMVLMGI